MSRKIIFSDISHLVNMIREQSAIITSYEGKIPQIEIDILMGNLRRLYDDYQELSRINRSYKAGAATEEFTKEESNTDQPPEEITVREEKKPDKIIPIEKKVTETIEEVPVQQTFKQKNEGKPIDLFADSEQTLGDKFKDQKKTFHDKLQDGNQEKTLGETVSNPIADLRTGIGVNDRFLLINELFGGVMGDYDKAMELLNAAENLGEARQRLEGLKSAQGWSDTLESLRRLEQFIKRRFTN